MTTYLILYPPNSMVFERKKAKYGQVVPLYIKKYLINNNVIVYKDTTNRLWFERELCPQSVAVELAIAYYERILAEIEELED